MRNKSTLIALFVILAPARLSAAQQDKAPRSRDPKDSSSVYAELARVPEKARAKRSPLEHDPDAVAAGKNLFEQHCAECHGATAEGGKKAPSLRAEEVQGAEPGAIFWILTNGVVRKGMPVWSKLPEPRRWQLVAYVKSLGTVPAKEPEVKPANAPQGPTKDSSSLHR